MSEANSFPRPGLKPPSKNLAKTVSRQQISVGHKPHSGPMINKALWFLNGIKLLVLLFLIWSIVTAYTLYLTWAIMDYLNAVVELAQLY